MIAICVDAASIPAKGDPVDFLRDRGNMVGGLSPNRAQNLSRYSQDIGDLIRAAHKDRSLYASNSNQEP